MVDQQTDAEWMLQRIESAGHLWGKFWPCLRKHHCICGYTEARERVAKLADLERDADALEEAQQAAIECAYQSQVRGTECIKLGREVVTLRQNVADLERDAARLDWLAVDENRGHDAITHWWSGPTDVTFRQAIDAAITDAAMTAADDDRGDE